MQPIHLRDLNVEPGAHPRGQPHLSAASGLVLANDWLYLVADDEHHLGVIPAGSPLAPPVRLHRLLPQDLPADKATRKRDKPDLEALALLQPTTAQSSRRLLALGSGSRASRERGVLLALDAAGQLTGDSTALDLSALYAPLHAEFADLNIEGAFVAGAEFLLLQRGNKGDARNASITYLLADLLAWLDDPQRAPPGVQHIQTHELGDVDGVPLGFTDGTPLPDGGWLFSAVAEDTSDSYNDGACAASMIGWMDPSTRLRRMLVLDGKPKVEGLALAHDGRLWMVTDADDPATPSQLLAVATAELLRS